jgi:hypothetical protein
MKPVPAACIAAAAVDRLLRMMCTALLRLPLPL